ncbi:hypothetical protein [Methylocystis sp. JR02]|nr:hypothetical protein [Methylocystis sp. JR02]MDJ0450651.1 hypothetical protein [Methylocystis sp. JR02]
MTLPIGVFANDGDFTNYEVSNEALEARITLAAERSIGHLRPR